MENYNLEIIGKENGVSYEVPQVLFPAYEEVKAKAKDVAAYIDSQELTEENVKEIKGTLADARKLTERMDRIRIDMKKHILTHYVEFETQIREITGIIDTADAALRGKVKDMEEAEREAKKADILCLWRKRIYAFPVVEKVMPDAFDRWITPKHLNKTTTMKKVESDMVAWIQKTINEMDTAQSMGDEYLAVYGSTGDLATAIQQVNAHRDAMKTLTEFGKEYCEEPTETYIITGKKDIALVERLFEENNIDYIKL